MYWTDKELSEKLGETRAIYSECRRCSLAEGRIQTVQGFGKVPCLLALVGEAPGRNEDQQGLPFIGAAGNELDRALKALRVDRSDLFLTNAVACRPPNNATPDWSCIKACLTRLHSELYLASPLLIVALGKTAASALVGTENVSMQDLLGRFTTVDIQGIHVPFRVSMLTTHHPARLIHAMAESKEQYRTIATEFFSHLSMAVRVAAEYHTLGGSDVKGEPSGNEVEEDD